MFGGTFGGGGAAIPRGGLGTAICEAFMVEVIELMLSVLVGVGDIIECGVTVTAVDDIIHPRLV
jgi:hypothetical protein